MYTHYGVNVDIIQSEGSFRDRLISQNIAFQELPVVNCILRSPADSDAFQNGH